MNTPDTKPRRARLGRSAKTTALSALVSWVALHAIMIPVLSYLRGPVYQDFYDEGGSFMVAALFGWSAICIFGLSFAALLPILVFSPKTSSLILWPILGMLGALTGVLFEVFYFSSALADESQAPTALIVAGLCGAITGIFASFRHRRISSLSESATVPCECHSQ